MAELMNTTRRTMRLGEMLVSAGLISQDRLPVIVADAKKAGLRIGEYLVQKGIVSEQQVLDSVADQINCSVYNQHEFEPDLAVRTLIPVDFALPNRVLPLKIIDDVLYIALQGAPDFSLLDRISEMSGHDVEPVLCSRDQFLGLTKAIYGDYGAFDKALSEFRSEQTDDGGISLVTNPSDENLDVGTPNDAPVIRLVNLILTEGVRVNASDIHICPEKTQINVRYRIDGLLRNASVLPRTHVASLASRVKILGNMDISVTRVPQDGRFTVRVDNREINVRVSTMPTTNGENIVMRLLDMSSTRVYSLGDMGMCDSDRVQIERSSHKPYGMILSTGPTGSGKSTSMYSILRLINREDINIITLEDPVEYRMDGVRQVQLNTKAGMTFASGLRAILRQDPDVLMVGEIRDGETARIAVQAALTGHLVLSTLHTNDALGAVARLVDMGLEPYLVASVLLNSFAQRLVRRICPHCRENYEPRPEMLAHFSLSPADGPFTHGAGCTHCGGTGYLGRVGLFEVCSIDGEMQMAISQGRSMQDLYALRRAAGGRSMVVDASEKILSGITTVEEAIRVTMV